MKCLFTIFLLHFYFLFFGQITYTKIPLDLQLVARDITTNLGNVNFEGEVDLSAGYESLRIQIYRNDVLFNTVFQSLTYIDSKALFAINISIQAELVNYSFKIYGYKSSNDLYVLDKTISNIVAGDTYIIQGQSNAVAGKKSGSANSNISNFIRVYSSGNPDVQTLLANDAWNIADGDVYSTTNGNTGQWGLKLAKLLIDNLGVPIAIFNGAHGGKAISFFKAPQDYQVSQNSNYGRLYYRLNKTGLKNSVKAVFWSQGEANSNSSDTSTDYVNNFNLIKSSWSSDYPSIEKIYIFQTKDCECATTPDGKMRVKEAQRLLAVENSNITVMPTTSLFLHIDDCHFPFKNGYEGFANRIYKLVLHDIYGKNYDEEIKAPMIKSAEFTESNILVLETDAVELKFSSTDQTTMLTRLIKDFELKSAQNASITNVSLSGNKILFTLSGNPGPIANISFVGYNSNIGFTITNSSDIELISFRNFPIKNLTDNNGDNSNFPIIENVSLCRTLGSTTYISILKPNSNAIYSWLYKTPTGDWTTIKSSNAGNVYVNYNSSILEINKTSTLPIDQTLFRVIATYSELGLFTSNEVVLTLESAPVSKTITGITTTCAGTDITLTYGSGSIGSILWQYSTTSGQEDFIDDYIENGLTYTIANLQKTTWFRVVNTSGICEPAYSKTFQVIVNPKPVAGFIIGGNVNVCKTTNSTILSLKDYVGSIRWQKATSLTGTYSNISSAVLETYTASGLTATTYFRAVLTSETCTQVITEPVVIIVNSTPLPSGDSIQIFNFNSPVFVSDLIVKGSNIKWYSSISDALINTNALDSTSQLALGNTYYAMQYINGCFSIAPLAVTLTSSLGFDEYKSTEIKLFPNPFNNSFIVEYTNKITSIELFNVLGQSVLKINSDTKEVVIDVNFLPSGIYFAKIISEDHNTLIKGIKL